MENGSLDARGGGSARPAGAFGPDRVMVCVSSSTLASRVIRSGARLAQALGARWYAVYVETPAERPGRMAGEARRSLESNFALAAACGAAVVRVRAETPAEGLIAFARREAITHVVLGETARSRWQTLVRGSTLDRLLASIRDASVKIVPFD